MLKIRLQINLLITSLIGAVLLLSAENAAAQQCTIQCPSRAPTEKIVRDLIRVRVSEEVDTSRYSDAKISVRMKKISLTPEGAVSAPLDGLLSGIEIQDSNHQPGLAFGVEGQTSVSFSQVCEYVYRVTITTRARDSLEHGARLVTQTESYINLVTPLAGRARCRK